MPDYCTCGAELPPDALFCHKCGKPQREIQAVEPELQPPPTFTPPPPAPVPPGFRNPVALRIALLVAACGTVTMFLPYLNFLGAGFFAAWFYRRRTGQLLKMEWGVRLGWITGLFMFGMITCLLMAAALFFRAAGGVAALQAQLKTAPDPRILEGLRILQNGPELAAMLVQLFLFTTVLSMAGGALGAKLGRKT